MKTGFLLIFFLYSFIQNSFGQKPPLDHNVYDGWKSISSPFISADGRWITYEVNPQQGDGWLYIYNVAAGSLDSAARGSKSAFAPESRYVVYQVAPSYNETREAKKKKLKEDQMPKNDIQIRLLPDGQITSITRVKSFAVPENKSFWMAYLLEKKLAEKKDSVIGTDSLKVPSGKKMKSGNKPDSEGTEFVINDPVAQKEFRFDNITEYAVARDGKSICFLQQKSDTTGIDSVRVFLFDTVREKTSSIFESRGSVKKLTTDRSGNLISFLYTSDTSKTRIYDLWVSKTGAVAFRAVDTLTRSMPPEWSVSENGNIMFSDDGTRLFFGTSKRPVKEREDTLLDDEKYRVDIWSWTDDVLQPMQKKQLNDERNRSFQAVYHIDRSVMFQMADSSVPEIRTFQKGNGDIALASSNLKYRKSLSWDNNQYTDYYIVNLETGTRKLILENSPAQVYLSPDGNYLLIYDPEGRSWLSIPSQGGQKKDITASIQYPLYDELNDVPDHPRPYGLAGFIDDNRHAIIYDKYDLWQVDLAGTEKPVNITNSFGRNNNLRLRFLRLDNESEFIGKKEALYLSAFNYGNKESGYFMIKEPRRSDPQMLIMDKASFSRNLTKAKNAGQLMWQRETFAESPELYTGNMSLQGPGKISDANPQQTRYNWLTAELVEWTSFDNSVLQGILYKPEDFDPSRKYPMIVYFYERSSDGLYNYFAPVPSTSIINRAFAASNGYLLFVPDIPYKIGYPGQSCYNAVVSGTKSLIDKYDYIDRNRLGLDGQSWGGYQIAWLVTRTDLFACAYSGAPVSNMISAYGGIRWESGMSRMFQYEHSQSRIGGTLWDKPLQFIENSPIFSVPEINTPLLIMHNDADGAVPWYQGIEFFVALRRLGKPAWFLSYNDEAHNLVKRPNRKDISVRKMQFFDHYLKGAPMPYWMKYGITQDQKGKEDGYNLINDLNQVKYEIQK